MEKAWCAKCYWLWINLNVYTNNIGVFQFPIDETNKIVVNLYCVCIRDSNYIESPDLLFIVEMRQIATVEHVYRPSLFRFFRNSTNNFYILLYKAYRDIVTVGRFWWFSVNLNKSWEKKLTYRTKKPNCRCCMAWLYWPVFPYPCIYV